MICGVFQEVRRLEVVALLFIYFFLSTAMVAAEVVVVVVAAAVAAGGGETRIMIVAMTAMTDTTSMTIGIVAAALRHPTTVDTGLAQGLAPTAHDDTKLLLSTISFLPIIDGV